MAMELTIKSLQEKQKELRQTFDSARKTFDKASVEYKKAKVAIVEFTNSYGRVLEVLEPAKKA